MAVIILGSGVTPVTGTREFCPIPGGSGSGGGSGDGDVTFGTGDINNYVITSTGVGDQIQGEPNLEFNGTVLSLTGDLNLLSGGNISVDSMDVGFSTYVMFWNSGTGAIVTYDSGGGTDNFLRADGTWNPPPGASIDIVGSPSDGHLAIWDDPDTLTSDDGLNWNGTILNVTGNLQVTGAMVIYSGLEVAGLPNVLTINTANDRMYRNDSGGGTTNYLRADGAWADPVTVNISGTPLATEVAIWSNSNTLHADSNFTFNGGIMTVESIIQTQRIDELNASQGVRFPDKVTIGKDTASSSPLTVYSLSGSGPATIVISNSGNGAALSIAGTSTDTMQLNTVVDDATNTITRGLTISHQTTDTVASGFGTGILLANEFNPNSNVNAVAIDAVVSDATASTADANLSIKLVSNAVLEERFIFGSDGAFQADIINEFTSTAGVTIEGVLIKDSDITIATANYAYFNVGETSYIYDDSGVLTFVDTASGSQALADLISGATFDSGLIDTAGNIDIGGALTVDADFTGSYDMRFGTIGSNIVECFIYASGAVGINSMDQIYLNFNSGGKEININASYMQVDDDDDEIGLQYAADYSTNGAALGDRWIPDKGYVDSEVAGAGGLSGAGGQANDQIAVWTDASTLEGTANLTLVGTTLDVNNTITVDVITEHTGSAGVTIEGVVLEDNDITLSSTNFIYFDGGTDVSIGDTSGYLTIRDGTEYLRIGSGLLETNAVFAPNANKTINLGGSAYFWNDVFFDRVYIDDTSTYLDIDTGDMTFTDTNSGTVTLATLAAGGVGVAKISGTPGNNQIGVWTSSTEIEGDSNLTWTGTAFDINGSITLGTGATVDTIETTLTDDDTHIPTSGAVVDAIAGFGDVSKVGTPVNNQIGIWTGDGTLEGDATLYYSSGYLVLGSPTGSRVVQYAGNDYNIAIRQDSGTAELLLDSYHNTANQGNIKRNWRTGGTMASPLAVPTDALIMTEENLAHDGTSRVTALRHRAYVDGVVATNDFDTKYTWELKEGGSAIALMVTLGVDGFEYDNDHSTDQAANDRWIPDKGYVDSVVGSGDVTKVDTPVDNEIGVWTGDGTLEGDAALTFDGTTLNVDGDIMIDRSGTPVLELTHNANNAIIEPQADYGLWIPVSSGESMIIGPSAVGSTLLSISDSYTTSGFTNVLAVLGGGTAVFTIENAGSIYMEGLGDDDTEDHVIAIDDSTGLLTKRSVASLGADVWKDYTINTVSDQNYTLVLTDAHKLIRMTYAGGSSIGVPQNSDVAFPIGTVIRIAEMNSSGNCNINELDSTTIYAIFSPAPAVVGHGMGELIKIDTDEWMLTGDLVNDS